MANIKSKLGKGAKRYGDLLAGKTLKSKANNVLDSARVVDNANRAVNELKGGVKSTKDFLRYKKADKVLGKYTDDFTAAQKGYIKEALKSTGARAATSGAVGAAYAGVSNASKSRKEKTAFDIIEEAFDKVASLNFKKSKNIGKALKNVATGKKEIAKTVGLGTGTASAVGAAGYGTAKALKNKEKTASYIVEDSFDKVAGIKETLLKQSGKAKEMIGKHSGKAKEVIGKGAGKAKEIMNSDKVKRYGDLLKGDTLKSKKKSVLGAASLTQKANKGYEETRKGVKSTADFIASQKAGKRVDRYGDHFLGTQKEYGKELLKSTGARAATIGAAGATGYGIAKASKKEEK